MPGDRSQPEEVARIESRGRVPEDRRRASRGWVVMADTEGNEFCVEAGSNALYMRADWPDRNPYSSSECSLSYRSRVPL